MRHNRRGGNSDHAWHFLSDELPYCQLVAATADIA